MDFIPFRSASGMSNPDRPGTTTTHTCPAPRTIHPTDGHPGAESKAATSTLEEDKIYTATQVQKAKLSGHPCYVMY